MLAGLTPTKERENRAKGVNFILQVGIMLKLPQLTLATASVFLHRFFMRYSMKEDPASGRPWHHYYAVAAASLFLATKVEENCRKMKDLVVQCARVAQKQPDKVVDEQDKEFWRWRDTILQLEDTLLEALCFDLSLVPPYATLYAALLHFGHDADKPLRNAAWAFVNDSCLTPLCLLYPSRTIAAAAIYAAARHVGTCIADDDDGRPWWEVLGVELRHVRRACNYMASVYENAPLRGGVEESMYQRTPEDGDEVAAKTRKARPEGERGKQLTRRGSGDSEAGSEASRKRGRDERDVGADAGMEVRERGVRVQDDAGRRVSDDAGGDIPWGGETKEESEAKRRKFDTVGHGREANKDATQSQTNGMAEEIRGGGLVSPTLDDGSEEGEVES